MSQNLYCATLSISQYLQMSDRIYVDSSTGAGLSSRAEFPVSYPRSKKPIQTRFSATAPEQVPWMDRGSSPFVVGNPGYKPSKSGTKTYNKPNPRSDLA